MGHYKRDPECKLNDKAMQMHPRDRQRKKEHRSQFFSQRGSVVVFSDPNPIINSGCLVIIGGYESAARLWKELCTPLLFGPNKNSYLHGWGHKMANSKPAICSWKLNLNVTNDNPFEIDFDTVEGEDPLIIGDNILKFANHLRLTQNPILEIMIPPSDQKLIFSTHPGPIADKYYPLQDLLKKALDQC